MLGGADAPRWVVVDGDSLGTWGVDDSSPSRCWTRYRGSARSATGGSLGGCRDEDRRLAAPCSPPSPPSSPCSPPRSPRAARRRPSSPRRDRPHDRVGTLPVTKMLVFVVRTTRWPRCAAACRGSRGWPTATATRPYRAITHPRCPTYLAIAGGAPSASPTTSRRHYPVRRRRLRPGVAAGSTATIYAEGMTSNCRLTDTGRYAVRHNRGPTSVASGPTAGPDVPLSQLATTSRPARCRPSAWWCRRLQRRPRLLARRANAWLRSQVGAVLDGSDFTSGRLAVVITADEDDRHHGNRVLTVVAHPDLHHRVVTRRLTHYALSRSTPRSPASTCSATPGPPGRCSAPSGSPADISTEMRAVPVTNRSSSGARPAVVTKRRTCGFAGRGRVRHSRHGRTWGQSLDLVGVATPMKSRDPGQPETSAQARTSAARCRATSGPRSSWRSGRRRRSSCAAGRRHRGRCAWNHCSPPR